MNKKRRKSFAKPILLISSIAVLNFSGVSYAYWTDSPEILHTITTAKMGPKFYESILLDPIAPNLDNSEVNVTFEDEHTIKIEGVVDPKYKAFLHYCINNDGDIPVKFENGIFEAISGDIDMELTEDTKGNDALKEDKVHQNGISNGLKLQLNQQAGIMYPEEEDKKHVFFSKTGDPKLHIQAEEPGTYEFEINLFFKQWTDTDNSK